VPDSQDPSWPILIRFLTNANMQPPGNADLTKTPDEHDNPCGSDSTPRMREGLPPTYRMRADAHYVEQLDAPTCGPMVQSLRIASIDTGATPLPNPIPPLVDSIKRHGVLQPLLVQRRNGRTRLIDGRKRLRAAIALGLDEVPCLARDIDDQEVAALAVGANLVQSTTSPVSVSDEDPSIVLDIHDALVRTILDLDSSAHLLSSSASSLSLIMGTALIRAEAWRAGCLLQASRIVHKGVPRGELACSPTRVVKSVVERAESERRIRGYMLHVECDIPETLLIVGDPTIVGTTLSGLLFAITAVADGRPGARIAFIASLKTPGQLEFTLSQIGVGVSKDWELRAFDAGWTDRPGGIPAVAWMVGARRVAEAYGGVVSVAVTLRGASVKMVLPLAAG
jgi:hypothetical protein